MVNFTVNSGVFARNVRRDKTTHTHGENNLFIWTSKPHSCLQPQHLNVLLFKTATWNSRWAFSNMTSQQQQNVFAAKKSDPHWLVGLKNSVVEQVLNATIFIVNSLRLFKFALYIILINSKLFAFGLFGWTRLIFAALLGFSIITPNTYWSFWTQKRFRR